ncbi:DUF2569 domain-containing protein [Bacillus timonensis]|nr:DUF2569 domain-containing protein [Bacillus timonensis]
MAEKNYERIGGFLYFIGFTIILEIIYSSSLLYRQTKEYVGLDIQKSRIDHGELHTEFLLKILQFDIIAGLLMIPALCFLLSFFLDKRKLFPVAFLIIYGLFLLSTFISGHFYSLIEENANRSYFSGIFIYTFFVLYFLNSERVKKTFIYSKNKTINLYTNEEKGRDGIGVDYSAHKRESRNLVILLSVIAFVTYYSLDFFMDL